MQSPQHPLSPTIPVSTTLADNQLRLKRLGIDTYKHPVIYMQRQCVICQAEGFEAQTRLRVTLGEREIIATLNVIDSDLLSSEEVGLSNWAWHKLHAKEGDLLTISHAPELDSLRGIRAKLFGATLDKRQLSAIINDIAAGRYADIHLAAFVSACAAGRMTADEIVALTEAMLGAGSRLDWGRTPIADKHCIGGLPGNRTSLLVVPIIAAAGLTMPKTSSRAITSPAGTADTMEVLAPVNHNLVSMRRIVEREGGCIVWGGSVSLSPADDILISVERPLEIDSEAQLVASVISKKLAAGSTHGVIDIPFGPSAKVRSLEAAHKLGNLLAHVGQQLGLALRMLYTDGSQPVGRGVGPALEARDVLAVLRRQADAPQDLRERALRLAGELLEFCGAQPAGLGYTQAQHLLDSGLAFDKFLGICDAQGGFREPVNAKYTRVIEATTAGRVTAVDNRHLAKIAKLAGAPKAASAGIDLHIAIGAQLTIGQPMFTLHAETPGELQYAHDVLMNIPPVFMVEP